MKTTIEYRKLEESRKRILSFIMDFIHAENLKFIDNFPIKISETYMTLIKKYGELPNLNIFIKNVNKIRTTFFKINTNIKKKEFLEELLNQLNREFKYILKDLIPIKK